VRFCVTSRTSPTNPNYGIGKEESTLFILVCELVGPSNLRMSLYAETGFRSSPKPEGLIDPFRHIDQYGPLGDPFSLCVLSPGEREDRRVKITHTDQRHNYIVSTRLDAAQSPPFQVMIDIDPSDEYSTWRQPPEHTQQRQLIRGQRLGPPQLGYRRQMTTETPRHFMDTEKEYEMAFSAANPRENRHEHNDWH